MSVKINPTGLAETATFLRASFPVGKCYSIQADGTWKSIKRGQAKYWTAVETPVSSLDEFAGALREGSLDPCAIFVRGGIACDDREHMLRRNETLADRASRFVVIDVDGLKGGVGFDAPRDPAEAAVEGRRLLPPDFHETRCHFYATASHWKTRGKARVRLIFEVSRAVTGAELDFWFAGNEAVDRSVFGQAQPVYLGVRFEGCDDPIVTAHGSRWGALDGEDLVVVPAGLEAKTRETLTRLAEIPEGVVVDDPVEIRKFVDVLSTRSAARIEREGRRNSIRLAALDGFDRGLSEGATTAILTAWAAPEDAREDLVEALADVPRLDAGQVADTVIAVGVARLADCPGWGAGDVVDAISRQIADARSGCKGIGSLFGKALPGRDSGQAFGAVVDDDLRDLVATLDAAGEDMGQICTATGAIRQHVKENLPRATAILAALDDIESEVLMGGNVCTSKGRFEALLATMGEGKAIASVKPASGVLAPFRERAFSTIPPRRFVYGRSYVRGYLSATVSPGGVGKSSLLTAEAIAMATGQPLLGIETKPLRVLLWNLEDPLDEVERRVAAVMKAHGIGFDELGSRLFIRSGREHPLKIGTTGPNGFSVDRKAVAALAEVARLNRLDTIILDPFVSLHGAPENDNGAIDAVAKALGEVAGLADVAIMLAVHTRKPSAAGEEPTAADTRGASALVDACRDVRTLVKMKDGEAGKLGVTVGEAWRHIRFGAGKTNLSPPADRATWFRLESVNLDNATADDEADSVQVLRPYQIEVEDDLTATAREKFLELIQQEDWRVHPNDKMVWAGTALAGCFREAPDDTRLKYLLKLWVDMKFIKVENAAVGTNNRHRRTVQIYRPGSRGVAPLGEWAAPE